MAAPMAVAAVALLAGVVLLLRSRVVSVTVHGESMAPAYRDGDTVLVLRRKRCAVGDVVVFRHPRTGAELKWLVKRVAAIPGDPVPALFAQNLGPGPVPDGHMVVRSDAEVGLDSRQLGYVPRERILGVAWRRGYRAGPPGDRARSAPR